MDIRASIIANPDGDSWDFAQRVFEYLKKKEAEDFQREKEAYIARVENELARVFPDDPLHRTDEKKKFAGILYDCMGNGDANHFQLNPLRTTHFPDGEYRVYVENNIRGSHCFFIHDSNLNPALWHSQLDFINNALRNSSASRIINVLPYLKFSRQDRKDISRTSINAQAISEKSVYSNAGVLTVDVHTKAIQGFHTGPSYSESFDSLESFPTLIKHLRNVRPELLENLVVLCPDEGAKKRFGDYTQKYGFGLAMVDKSRDKNTGKISIGGICGDDVSGKHVLIPDDIAASGETQIAGARISRQYHALSVIGYVTFGLFTKGIERVASELDLLLVSDIIKQPYIKSLYTKENPYVKPANVEEVTLVPLIGEGIHRIHTRESLSALYN